MRNVAWVQIIDVKGIEFKYKTEFTIFKLADNWYANNYRNCRTFEWEWWDTQIERGMSIWYDYIIQLDRTDLTKRGKASLLKKEEYMREHIKEMIATLNLIMAWEEKDKERIEKWMMK